MTRQRGINAGMLFGWESSYGVPHTEKVFNVPFTGNSLDSEQGLEPSNILGLGRDPIDPFRGVVNVDGEIGVPVEPRYMGLWLTALHGSPVTTSVAATGRVTFSANPSVGHKVTINGVEYTFHASASAGTNIEIKGTAILTVAEVVSVLNASVNGSVDDATYAQIGGQPILTVTHDTAGPGGNAFTLAASHAQVSASTLTGGCYQHVFSSGAMDIPSFWTERQLKDIPDLAIYTGVKLNSMGLSFARSGGAIATLQAIAQGEDKLLASKDETPEELPLSLISQFNGEIRSGGVRLGNITSSSCAYSNNLDRVETIRDDGKIEGLDPGEGAFTGTVSGRLADMSLIELARAGTPLPLEFAYTLSPGASLVLAAPRVFLPKPKIQVNGPGGVEVSFNFEAKKDSVSGKMMTATLRNDQDGTDYVIPTP